MKKVTTTERPNCLPFIRGHQRFEMSRQNLEAMTTELNNNQARSYNYEVIAGLLLSCTTGSHIHLITFLLFCILNNTSWPLHEKKQKCSVEPDKDCIILEQLFPTSENWLNNHSRWTHKTLQNYAACGSMWQVNYQIEKEPAGVEWVLNGCLFLLEYYIL